MSAPLAKALRSAFASYRAAMEAARDPDAAARERELAWARAANARARLERGFQRMAGETGR
jgi:hypothetical protein